MADYYSILNKTISGLSNNTPQMRDVVYTKARVAIEKQLRALQPTPSEEAIAQQLVSLEDAIKLIEDEKSQSDLASEPAQTPAPAKVDEVSEETAEPTTQTQSDTLADTSPSPAEPAEPPVAAPSPIEPSQPEVQTSYSPVEPTQTTPTPDTSDYTPPSVNADDSSIDIAGDFADSSSIGGVQNPKLEPSVSQASVSEPIATTNGDSVKRTEDALDAMSVAVGGHTPAGSSNDAPETVTLDGPLPQGDSPKPKRKFGPLLASVAILALLGGGAYALWLNKDALLETADKFVNSASTQQDTASEENNDEAAAIEKEAVRIGEDGQDKVADPVDENATSSGQTELPVLPEPTIETLENNQDQSSEENQPAPETQTSEPEVNVVEEPGTQTQEPEQPATVKVAAEPKLAGPLCGPLDGNTVNPSTASDAQIGYLYEEGGANNAPTRLNAAVVWNTEQQILENSTTPESVIIGDMYVPDKGLALNVTIKRNIDTAVSASHYIELRFNWPSGFSGQGVEDIGRFVMKATEEQPGQPLDAVPVKVNEKCILLALQNLPKTVELNTALLSSAGWIDIPISYKTGTRALLTLAKGDTGTQAFNDAFADWKNK